MQCPKCNAPLEQDATFCGNCGNQIAPMHAQGVTVASTSQQMQPSTNNPNFAQSKFGPPSPMPQPPPPQQGPYSPMPDTPSSPPIYRGSPQRSLPSAFQSRRLALIVAAILLIIAGSTIALVLKNTSNTGGNVAAGIPTGLVRFIDSQNSQGHTDSLNINIVSLAAPPAGSQYFAWFINDQNEQTLALGQLTANSQGFSLTHNGNATNLLGLGDKLEVTVEQGKPNLPTGKVVLTGIFPPHAFIHIKHLLFAFPTTPNHIGLLVGMLAQTQQLNAQAQLLQNAIASHNTLTIQCIAQSMLDIIEGAQGPHYHPLSPACTSQNVNIAGDGYGLLGPNGYIATAEAHASLAATQNDSTPLIRVHAGHVEICANNIQGWVTTVDKDALALLAHPDQDSNVQAMLTLSDHAYHGVDINGDEQIDPVPGEGGAITAYIHGQLMATLTLVANS